MTDEAIIDSSTNQNDEKLESRDHSNYQSANLRAHNSGENIPARWSFLGDNSGNLFYMKIYLQVSFRLFWP